MKILEIKNHLNKPVERYTCDLLKRDGDVVILKYVSDRSGRLAGVFFDSGSITYAIYRSGEGHVLWKLLDADQNLKGHLFHVCRDIVVAENTVEYLDMLLDVWIDSDGMVKILDRDEVAECEAKGVIGDPELAWISRQEKKIVENHKEFIRKFDDLLRGLK
jgi:predicted RNA-binding protein associated with RNAse of E/G family